MYRINLERREAQFNDPSRRQTIETEHMRISRAKLRLSRRGEQRDLRRSLIFKHHT